jgi:signal transduction histidine kinase
MRSLLRTVRSRTPWARLADPALAAILAVLSFLPLGVPGIELGDLRPSAPASADITLALLQTVPLAVRSRWPVPVLLVIGAAFSVAQLTGAATGLAGLGLLVAIYSAAVHQRTGRWVTWIIGLLAYCGLAVTLSAAGSPERPVDWVTFVGVLVTPWCLGLVVRDRLDRESVREAASARRAVRAARAALAQDLHDVVTHHVTAMVIQADSARFAAGSNTPVGVSGTGDTSVAVTADARGEEVRSDLASIAATGRAALSELRVLLDALDPPTVAASVSPAAARRPAAGDLDALVSRLARSGYAVRLQVHGEPHPSPAAAGTVHDVAREAITNAMKHAPGAPVACQLRVDGSELELVVVNSLDDPSAPGAAARTHGSIAERGVGSPAAGRGIIGMTERARRVGGSLHAGVETGAYRVVLRLPADDVAEAGSGR